MKHPWSFVAAILATACGAVANEAPTDGGPSDDSRTDSAIVADGGDTLPPDGSDTSPPDLGDTLPPADAACPHAALGGKWTIAKTGDLFITNMSMASADNAWFCSDGFRGDFAPLLKWNGSSLASVVVRDKFSAYSIVAINSDDVWANGVGVDVFDPYGNLNGQTYHWQGTSWEMYIIGAPSGHQPAGALFYAMWASSSSDVWGVGDEHLQRRGDPNSPRGVVMRFDGSGWSTLLTTGSGVTAGGGGGPGEGVGGAMGGSAWVTSAFGFGDPPPPAERPNFERWDPAAVAFVREPAPPGINGEYAFAGDPYGGPWLWFASDERPWFASETPPAVFVFDSATWKTDDSVCPLGFVAKGLWGTSETDLWAVGKGGRIAHRDGSGWHDVESGTKEDLSVVQGSGPNDVWAGGDHVLLHYTAP